MTSRLLLPTARVADIRHTNIKTSFVIDTNNRSFELLRFDPSSASASSQASGPPLLLRTESAKFRNGSRRVVRYCPEPVFSR